MNTIEITASTVALMQERVEEKVQYEQQKNIIFVVQGIIGLEAIEDRIIILIDKFRSGYECKDCNETGIYAGCECFRETGQSGVKANGKTCYYKDQCSRQVVGNRCLTCNGTGSTIVIPETSTGIPTSGTIVSIGPLVTKRQLGERMVFGAHTGYFLPFKGNAKLRVMREDEPLAKIYSIDRTKVLGDFMQIDEKADHNTPLRSEM